MGRVHLFIVSIDRDAPDFRASARRVDEEVAGRFDQPLRLLDFLVGRPPRAPQDRVEEDPDAPIESP